MVEGESNSCALLACRLRENTLPDNFPFFFNITTKTPVRINSDQVRVFSFQSAQAILTQES
jgi:hypothetical protein